MTARCGRLMRRYEASRWGIAVTNAPVCDRPKGHNGYPDRCKSRTSLAIEKEARIAKGPTGTPATGRRIREARKQARMSQWDLARALGVDQATVSAWELAKRDPAAVMLGEIAAATGVPASWLLGEPGGERRAA